MAGHQRPKASSLIQLTTRELEAFRFHHDGHDVLDEMLQSSVTHGALVTLAFDDEALGTFLDALEQTANSAQDTRAMDMLGHAFARITAGIAGLSDPGTHLLRPAAATLGYTQRQGQYLAFIHHYQKLHRQSPAESDLQRFFRVTAPTVHTMIVTLQRRGFITRTPGAARSMRLLLPAEAIPALE